MKWLLCFFGKHDRQSYTFPGLDSTYRCFKCSRCEHSHIFAADWWYAHVGCCYDAAS